MMFEFYEEENEFINYEFGDRIDNSKISQNLKIEMPISFYHATLEGEYGFNSITEDDSKKLIEKLIQFSTNSINYILDENNKEDHFHPSNNKKFKDKVKEYYGCSSDIDYQPNYYHFALYTNDDASRQTGVKSPRIHFLIGNQAVIYLLFYDPHHELC